MWCALITAHDNKMAHAFICYNAQSLLYNCTTVYCTTFGHSINSTGKWETSHLATPAPSFWRLQLWLWHEQWRAANSGWTQRNLELVFTLVYSDSRPMCVFFFSKRRKLLFYLQDIFPTSWGEPFIVPCIIILYKLQLPSHTRHVLAFHRELLLFWRY